MVKQAIQDKRAGQAEVLSSAQERQIRDVAGRLGLDADYLVRYLREARVERTPTGGVMVTPPPSLRAETDVQSRTRDFATELLGRAVRSGGAGVRPQFSTDVVASSAGAYITGAVGMGGRTAITIESGTEDWLRDLARRHGVDPNALVGCYVAYHSLSGAGQDVAARALESISGGDGRTVSLAMACVRNSRSREAGGASEFQIAQRDRAEVERDFARRLVPSRRGEVA